MIGTGYNEVLQMIMRKIKDNNPGTGSGGSFISTGSVTNVTNPSIVDPNPSISGPVSPKSFGEFEDYDYHLNYNDEDELISFTSHDGKITYTLEKDIYDDLVSVKVTTSILTFRIYLIFEYYDVRKNDPMIEDKGKLTDVILLDLDGKQFSNGFEVRPEKIVATYGDTVNFYAYNVFGEIEQNVSEVSAWMGEHSVIVTNGQLINPAIGTHKVTAIYGLESDYGILEIRDFELIVEVISPLINVGETAQFRSYIKDSTGQIKYVTSESVWSSDKFTGTLSGVNFNVTGIINPGEIRATATYKGKTANCKIVVKVQINIQPNSSNKYIGETSQYRAYTIPDNVDVTNLSNWTIDKYSISSGLVTNLTTVGFGNISAIYDGAIDNATLSVIALPLPPNTITVPTKLILKLYDNGSEDDDRVDVYVDNVQVLVDSFGASITNNENGLKLLNAGTFIRLDFTPGNHVMKFIGRRDGGGGITVAAKFYEVDVSGAIGAFLMDGPNVQMTPANSGVLYPKVPTDFNLIKYWNFNVV